MGSCRSDSGKISIIIVPRAFNSIVQPLRSSCISCGSTVLRVHASSHLGFGGASLIAACCAPFLTFDGPSLPLSLEKKLGIANADRCGSVQTRCIRLRRAVEKKSRQCDARLQAGTCSVDREVSRETSRTDDAGGSDTDLLVEGWWLK
jgi:hypothetical protein